MSTKPVVFGWILEPIKSIRHKGTQFKEIPQKEVSQREPGKKEEPKHWVNSNKMLLLGKPEPQLQPEPTAFSQIPDGISDEEF